MHANARVYFVRQIKTHKYLVYALVETKGFIEVRDGLGPLGAPEIT